MRWLHLCSGTAFALHVSARACAELVCAMLSRLMTIDWQYTASAVTLQVLEQCVSSRTQRPETSAGQLFSGTSLSEDLTSLQHNKSELYSFYFSQKMLSLCASTEKDVWAFHGFGAIAAEILTIAALVSFQQQLGVMHAPACVHTKLHTVEGSVHLHQQH